jgi:outer membrane lipoprotein-sorting protein
MKIYSKTLLFSSFLGFIILGILSCAGPKKASLKELKTPGKYREVSLGELVSIINTQARFISNFRASIFIDFKSASKKPQSIQGKLAIERPDKVLLVSYKELLPTLFTMVSDGTQFWLDIPSKKQVYVGKNKSSISSSQQENPAYNLRPLHLVGALLLEEVELKDPSQFFYLEVLPDTYVLNLGIKDETNSKYYPQRRFYLERENLTITRYQSFDDKSLLVSDVTYDNYKKVGKMMFPYRVDINRPWEGIELALTFREIEINTDLNPKMFTFSLPKDHKVVELGN